MHDALEPRKQSGWALSHEGYDVVSESAKESRFALGNGFLGMRAARSAGRGPTWVTWLGYVRWASWPRGFVAGLFDVPNMEPPVPAMAPVADRWRVRATPRTRISAVASRAATTAVRSARHFMPWLRRVWARIAGAPRRLSEGAALQVTA